MQNRWNPADEAGYVMLGGGWVCGRCGCSNEGCDVCGRCGWNRCGCQGGVTAARQTGCACEAAAARQTACPAGNAMGHSVQRCPENTAIRTAAQQCGCAVQEAAARSASCPEASGVGMVYGVDQTLGEVYQSESALRTGTLFPQLHKPMNGRCPRSANCATRGQQSAFAAWDLRLYLDTHPDDARALALFAQLSQEAEKPNYATAFLPGGTAWSWTDEPWPWECRPCNAQ